MTDNSIENLTIGEARKRLQEAKATVAELGALFGQAETQDLQEVLNEPIPVLVCTDKRGVVFGYTDQPKADPIPLTKARMNLYWSKATGGVFGLAERGPDDNCNTSAMVAQVSLTGVTAVFPVSSEAERAWNAAPVEGRS